MTRLLYVHNIAMPGPEANTVNVAKMCNAFAANGCYVALAALPGAPPHQLEGAIRAHYGLTEPVRIAPLPAQAKRPLAAALVGAGLARKHRADLVYTRAPHAALAASLAGFRSVLEIHTPPDSFSPIGRAAYRRALRQPRLAGVVCISAALASHLRGDIRDQTPLIVAHDGADETPSFDPPAPSDRLRVGFAGRFYAGKGLELIAQVAPLCPWADFHIVGGDAAAAAALIGGAPRDSMIFHGGVPHADVARHIAIWDVALAPYQRSVIVADGRTDAAAWMSPLKLFEYMAAGKTIVASDLPVLREILTDQVTALLAPPDDVGAWVAALSLLRDPSRRAALAARAHAEFRARYTWRQRARHILEALSAVKPPLEQVA